MSPVKKPIIEEKLKKLGEIITWLEQYKKVPKPDFLKDHTIDSATKHDLFLGIEIILDIGNHLLIETFNIRVGEYSEIIEKLGEKGIIPKEFAKENVDMAKFRNLLAHEYIKVEPEKVYENLQKAPYIFRQFAKAYQEFLDKI